MVQQYPAMYLILKLAGGTSMLMAFLLLLAPWYSIPLFILSFFMFFIAYEVFHPEGRMRLLDSEELVVVSD